MGVLLRLFHAIKERAFRGAAPGAPGKPPLDCLVAKYADCTDFDHCRHCGLVEQAARFTFWAEKSEPRLRGDGGSRDS